MNKTHAYNKENSMKKSLFIAVLAVVILVALAGTAFADKGSFVTSAGSAAGSYIAWSTAAGTNSGSTSPHGAYATTTVKCAVCHAVHQASDQGEILLKDDVANACNYCHVNSASTYSQVYGANPAYLSLDSNAHHTSNCGNCHSVHGAGTFTDASVAGLILKLPNAAGNFTGTVAAGKNAATATYDDAIGLTCARTGCHSSYYLADSKTHAPSAGVVANANGNFSHPMRALTTSWNGSGSGATKTGMQIAWKSSTTCKSCHDAEQRDAIDGDGYSFPHYTPGAARFLNSAANSGAVATGAGSSSKSGEHGTSDDIQVVGAESINLKYGVAEATTMADGVCLKCHRGSATSGVGLTY